MPGGSPAIIAAVFRAVRTGNAFEETVERLLEGVKLGVYAPGDRLPPERELTRRLGVSRITLREALRELAAAGYVETKRGRFGGTFIVRTPEPLVPDELTRTARDMGAGLDDALTFRRVVETGAAEMAARASLTRQQRESLAEALAAMQDCGSSGYRQADTRLHLAIADAAGSPQLTASVVEARVRLVDLLNAIPMLERNLEHANVQHAGIVRAILAGDPERARRAMAEHVAGTAALLRGFLETVLAHTRGQAPGIPQDPHTPGQAPGEAQGPHTRGPAPGIPQDPHTRGPAPGEAQGPLWQLRALDMLPGVVGEYVHSMDQYQPYLLMGPGEIAWPTTQPP